MFHLYIFPLQIDRSFSLDLRDRELSRTGLFSGRVPEI